MHTPRTANPKTGLLTEDFPKGGMPRKVFIQELHRLAGWNRDLQIEFLPPSDGFMVRWYELRPMMPGPNDEPLGEHFVKYTEMTEDTLTMFRVLWAVKA